jgi:hypothetical protein
MGLRSYTVDDGTPIDGYGEEMATDGRGWPLSAYER